MKRFLPQFHQYKQNTHLKPFHTFTNYWYLWIIGILILSATALTPLCFVTFIHYQLIQKSIESELNLRTERMTSNAEKSLAFFMEERLDALKFTVNEMGYAQLSDNVKLEEILKNLKFGFGGLTDLSVIDGYGNQVAYAGPFNLEGKNYKDQSWFLESLENENFVSEVFTGYRGIPHIIIAVRAFKPDGTSYTLRATLETERLIQKITSYKTGSHVDIFLINKSGILQTPSTKHGGVFSATSLIPPENTGKQVLLTTEFQKPRGKAIISGYAYIKTNMAQTPFILVVQKEKEGMMSSWVTLRRDVNVIVGFSIFLIMLVITLASTVMVNQLFKVDTQKAETMLKMEQSQQLASIGQLAAGVAHEINNPLAVINQTAGFVKDLYLFDSETVDKEEIIENIDDILDAVDRCGTITKQLLGFVRQFDVKIKEIDLQKMMSDILSFHKKEAEYKGIHVTVEIAKDFPILKSDSGKLQQVFVNLINNAFQAVEDDGCLDIRASQIDTERVEVTIQDTGCGIPEESLDKIHEPFFSTKQEKMGTGLGLSITYGLVEKLGGSIEVSSIEGVGTSFTIRLPVQYQAETQA